MADHRLRRADRDLVGVRPESGLDRARLRRVVQRCGRAVGGDVIDLIGRNAAVLHGARHGHCCAAAGWIGRGDVKRV